MRWTCCSAASRARGSCGRGPEAYVEGVFALPDALREELGERLPEDAEEVVLARRVSAEGRTRAYLGGRSATAADLRDVGGALLSFYGQHEHRKLTLASAQLEILDGFCGDAHAARLQAFGEALRPRAGAARAARGARGARRRARPRAGPARVGAQEIDDAAPSEAEEAELAAERERLRHLEALLGAAAGGGGRRARGDGRDGRPATASPRPALAGGGARALESVRGVDAGARRAGRPGARAGGRGRRPRDGAARLRRGRGGDARPPRRGRGAARAAGPPQAQARRHARGRARPRRGVPAPPRRAGGRRGGARGRPGRARRGARELAARPRSCARRARPPRARWPRPCASGWPRWRWTARRSRRR